ncbi:MAG: HAMP domain-containing sensor histidine kinase [Myxococcota bacterium]
MPVPIVAPAMVPRSVQPLGDAALARLLEDFQRARFVALPLMASFALGIAFADPSPWRSWVVGLALPLSFLATLVERILSVRGASAQFVAYGVVFVVATQLSMAFATGGLVSPGSFASILLGFAAAVAGAPAFVRGLAVLGQTVAFLVFAFIQTQDLLPRFIPFIFEGMATVGPSPGPWLVATIYILVAGFTHAIGTRLGRILREVYAARIRERDQTLHLMRTHAAELTLLSSEVAHELKNPLASVKGLAALLAPSLEGRAQKRMDVLRAEADRMQRVLEELLTLTRPIVPLELRTVDLSTLAFDVMELHQGLAVEAGVGLEWVPAAAPPLRCDERKIRPLLTNLLQNAIEATPPGRSVRLGLVVEEEGLLVEIFDEGPGLDPAYADRVFERGVTSKPTGSGIGLTMARTYAQQHGGDVTVEDAEGGGCMARLRLPFDPPQDPVPVERGVSP